jgi:formylglycine-generating enzyme required for sulfatase activity
VLVASIVGLVLVAGAGWWAMNEHRARLQAEAKAAVELAAAAEAKVVAETRAVGQTFRDCAECPEMVVLPAGSFDMGSNDDWKKRPNEGVASEKPVHGVSVPTFSIGKFEVTQAQWQAVMGSNPSMFKGCDDCPVEVINWEDVQGFLQKLNAKTGKRYRLPSEAEWEYACRAGGRHTYCGNMDIDAVAWVGHNSGGKTHPVGRKQANAFGVYDMTGNVYEFTGDCYNENYKGAPTNGSAWTNAECEVRMIRGGFWNNEPRFARSTFRSVDTPPGRHAGLGFRVALSSTRTLP